MTVFCFGEQPGIIDSFLSAYPKMEFQREMLLGVNSKEELFSIIPSCMVQVNATKRFVLLILIQLTTSLSCKKTEDTAQSSMSKLNEFTFP